MDERQTRASRCFPLRRIRCSYHYIRTEEKDPSGGSVFKGFYEVELMTASDGDRSFSSLGRVFFNSHAQAIAICMARLVGEFDRPMPEGITPPFSPCEESVFWSFDVQEAVRERHDDGSIRKGSRCTIVARRSVGEEPATYRRIGHFGVLGIAHIIDTISKDDHFGDERRMEIAMFRHGGKMYRATFFDPDFPMVGGLCITPGMEGEEISHLDYHSNIVLFYNFGTVVRTSGMYYLDGVNVVDIDIEPPFLSAEKDGVLMWIAENYPHASRYSFDTECGSLEWIRRNEGNEND